MATYSNGYPKLGNRPFSSAAAIYNGQLWLIGGSTDEHGNGKMRQSTLSLLDKSGKTIDIAGGALGTPANWHTDWLTIPNLTPATFSRCSAVTTDNGLYLFWNQPNNPPQVLAAYANDTSASEQSQWSSSIELRRQDGTTRLETFMRISSEVEGPSSQCSDVCVTLLDQNTILLACVTANWDQPSHTQPPPMLYLGVFDLNNIHSPDSGAYWPATWEYVLDASALQPQLPNVQDVGWRVSCEWFATGGSNSSAPQRYLAVYLAPDGMNGETAYFLAPLDATGVPQMDGLTFYSRWYNMPYQLTRDPAGRLQAYSTPMWTKHDYQPVIQIETFNTYAAIGQYNLNTRIAPLPYTTMTMQGANIDQTTPSALFFTDISAAEQVQVALGSRSAAATQYPVYEIIFYSTDVRCLAGQYGYAQELPNYTTITPKDTTKKIIRGIVDGPIPVPIQNLTSVEMQDTQHDFGDINYGVNTDLKQGHQVSAAWTVGIKDQMEVTDGVGAVWDTALSSGTGHVSGSTSEATDGQQASYSSLIKLEAQSDQPQPQIKAVGTLSCATFQINVTAYRFIDMDGNVVSDATTGSDSDTAPKQVLMQTNLDPDTNDYNYTPYSVCPGDLESYTPLGWNRTMQRLGYSGLYFQEVIEANAYQFKSGKPYQSVSWSQNAYEWTNDAEVADTFTEHSWTYDSSVYAGVGVAGGIDFFGLGEEISASIMVGFTVSVNGQSSDSKSDQWLLSFDKADRLPAIDDPAAIDSYAFRIYLLPVPQPPSTLPRNYWTQELIKYMSTEPASTNIDPAQIDPNSGAWKIVFVVTEYESVDKQNVYQFNSNDPQTFDPNAAPATSTNALHPREQPAPAPSAPPPPPAPAPQTTARHTVRQPPRKQYQPIRTLRALHQHLQWALSVELSTIPPYLCALYSIKDNTSEAYRTIRSVVVEEMLHMMLVGNLLNAVGKTPSLSEHYIPRYPGFIPHHAAGGPYIQLHPFSPQLMRTTFMPIEQPEESPHVPAEGEYFQTIGQFYKAIEEGFENLVRERGEKRVFANDTGFQSSDTYFGSGGGKLIVVKDLESAKAALREITQQGEGAPLAHPPLPGEERFSEFESYGRRLDGTYGPILGTPWELSHYGKFRMLADGTLLTPDTYPMQPNIQTDDLYGELHQLSELFNINYSLIIQALERALGSPDRQAFFTIAFPIMQSVLPRLATLLMQTTIYPNADPDLGPTAGPSFLYRESTIDEALQLAHSLSAANTNRGADHQQLWSMTLGQVYDALTDLRTKVAA